MLKGMGAAGSATDLISPREFKQVKDKPPVNFNIAAARILSADLVLSNTMAALRALRAPQDFTVAVRPAASSNGKQKNTHSPSPKS